MAMPYDVTTKELIEFNPPDWLAFLGLPNAPVKVVDADLATLSFEADKVLRVDDPLGAYILHLDFQSSYDATFDWRVMRYNMLLRERHGLPVISIGILLRPDAAGAGATGRIVLQSPQGMTTLDFSYTLLRVWEVPAEQFLNSGEALVPLAPLGKIAQSKVAGLIRKVKARLARILPQSREKKLRAAAYILMGLKYTDEFIEEVWGGTTDMKESVTYQKILREGLEEGREQGLEEGLEQGREQGREQGEIQHAYATLLRLGQRRFGVPSEEVVSVLSTISDVAQLDTLTDRIQEVESWDELLAPSS